jgi:hypothetical protein
MVIYGTKKGGSPIRRSSPTPARPEETMDYYLDGRSDDDGLDKRKQELEREKEEAIEEFYSDKRQIIKDYWYDIEKFKNSRRSRAPSDIGKARKAFKEAKEIEREYDKRIRGTV